MPHDLRRWGFALAQPRRFRRYQSLRTKANRWGYSYQQFDKHQAIFVHIPKAAGISVAQALFGCKAAGHDTVGVYQMVFSQADYNRYFKFTIVRNPWDRLLSAYTFLRQGGMTDHDKSWAAEHVLPYRDFNHFVEEGLSRPAVRDWTHFRPQLSFLQSYPGAEITLDFVGRFERLEEDVAHIGEHLSSPPHSSLERRNSSRRGDYREAYTERTRELAAAHYADDIAEFGYTFEGNL